MERDKRIDELIRRLEELKRKAEELKRKLEERKKPPVRPPEFKEVLRRLELEYEAYLTEHGVTNPRKCIEYVKEDIESLAEAVAKGELSFDEALHRVREIGIPPIARFRRVPGIPTAERPSEAIPPEERAFVTPAEAAEIIWSKYLPQLLMFGLRYVFENYGREFGMTEGILGRTAYALASKIRKLGIELKERGRRMGKGRYIVVGQALMRFPTEIVWKGVLKPMGDYIGRIYYNLRTEFPEIILELENVYDEEGHKIVGSVAKAHVGVLFDYLKIPRERWPSDIRICYERLEEIAPDP